MLTSTTSSQEQLVYRSGSTHTLTGSAVNPYRPSALQARISWRTLTAIGCNLAFARLRALMRYKAPAVRMRRTARSVGRHSRTYAPTNSPSSFSYPARAGTWPLRFGESFVARRRAVGACAMACRTFRTGVGSKRVGHLGAFVVRW